MKEKNEMANTEQYRAVLDDLMKQRDLLQFKVREIDTAVAALRRLMPIEEVPAPRDVQLTMDIATGKYADMSVRWSILNLLAEDALGPMGTAQIANALEIGGITTKGKNFSANVSAVLSDMGKVRGEVTSTPNGWAITPTGRESWIHAKAARERKATAATQESFDAPTLQ
jgi:hypothetical protein